VNQIDRNITALIARAGRKTYVDDPVIVTLKMLLQAGQVDPSKSISASDVRDALPSEDDGLA
jgi:hypothetical protein